MMQSYLEIDGSIGKGGGQVLRSSLAFSMGLGKPFTIYNIRRDRRKPGLRAQHLCAVRAAAQICGARLKGAELGSTSVSFEPGPVKPGEYEFFIDGGGSCTLVLQAILPPLLTAGAPSRITVHGATHNPLAPPFEYFDESLRPQLEKLGPRINARLNRHGFAPHGGGSITVEVEPVPRLRKFSLLKGGWGWERRLRIIACNLPEGLAEYEAEYFEESLYGGKATDDGTVRELLDQYWGGGPKIYECSDSTGPGNVLLFDFFSADAKLVLSAFGGTTKESARKAVEEILARSAFYQDYLGAADRFLSDQLVVPLALGDGGVYSCQKPTMHTETCLEIARFFTGRKIEATQPDSFPRWKIEISGYNR